MAIDEERLTVPFTTGIEHAELTAGAAAVLLRILRKASRQPTIGNAESADDDGERRVA